MRKLGVLTAVAVLAAVLGFNWAAWADDNADAVPSYNEGTFAEANNPAHAVDGSNVTFTSLGLGGDITVEFTDNVAVDGAGDDIRIFDRCGVNEGVDVWVSNDGTNFVPLGSFTAADFTNDDCGSGNFNATLDLDLSGSGLAGATHVMIDDDNDSTDEDGAGDAGLLERFYGLDIEEVVTLNSLDFGTAHIQKTLTGLTTIQVGVDFKQRFFFDIIISNPNGEDLTGIEFDDVVPAEFDVPAASSSDDAVCTVAFAEGGAKGKGKGNQKLAPDIITIVPVGLTGGETCTISVTIDTDDDHPGKGNSPDFTPTSCPGGQIVANEGVKVFDTSGAEDILLFVDDDSLTLTCIPAAPLIDSLIDCDGLATPLRECPMSQEVIRGDALTNWPTGFSNEGIDGFDNDSSNSWTLGDDIHIERAADGNCPAGTNNGIHVAGSDCVVLDLNASLFTGQPVDCDFETGTFCGAPPNLLTSGTGDLTFFDGIGADPGFYDTGEDIVLDVNKNGFFD